METLSAFNPAAGRFGLAAARPLQKHFARRQQLMATHQFDVGVWNWWDAKRVRISVLAQRLPYIQLRGSAIKQRADDAVASDIAVPEQVRENFVPSALTQPQ